MNDADLVAPTIGGLLIGSSAALLLHPALTYPTASDPGHAVAKRRGTPVLASKLEFPSRRDLDPRLLTGAALFGIGWGLVELCPGPALTMLPLGLWQAFVFVAALLTGMAIFRFLPTDWPQSTFRREPQGADA